MLAALVGIVMGNVLPAAGNSRVIMTTKPEGVLVWADEFNFRAGTLPDNRKWLREQGGQGWGNQELQCYTNRVQNAQTDGQGHLAVIARKEPGYTCSDGTADDYTSARLTTYGRYSFTYGRMEMRAKFPTASGMWPAFWALGTDIYTAGYPQSGELDTTEVVYPDSDQTTGSLHGPALDPTKAVLPGPYTVNGSYRGGVDLGDGFHVYGATWTADRVSFDLDGHTYRTITKAEVEDHSNPEYQWVFDKPFFLIVNLAVGGIWPGPPASSTVFPQKMLIDYVRVYQGS
jgi:beta-glucanase (GH16 family)